MQNKTNSLYTVLVLGGSLLVSAGAQAGEVPSEKNLVIGDAREATGFCNTPATTPDLCEVKADGSAAPRDGVTCCWGTSCAGD